MATRKVRYKKLNVKTPLPVLREDQIDPSEYESLQTEAQIATGVEQAEENVSWTSGRIASSHVHYHVIPTRQPERRFR
jgi:diadenosine tetraphosphate (Ap4A) HIT family hydrolase